MPAERNTRMSSKDKEGALNALRAFVAARNEGEGAVRSRILERCWAPEGRWNHDGARVESDRAGVFTRIGDDLDDPEFHVGLTGEYAWPTAEPGIGVAATWSVKRSTGITRERLRGRVGDDGLIAEMGVFPEAPDGGGLWRSLSAWGRSNPAAVVGVLGGTLYLTLRVPLGLFYGKLGVAPEDAGFGPQVLVPQSLLLLLVISGLVALGLLLMAMVFAIVRPGVATLRRRRMSGDDAAGSRDFVYAAAGYVAGFIVFGLWTVAAFALERDLPLGFAGTSLYVAAEVITGVAVGAWVYRALALRRGGGHEWVVEQSRRAPVPIGLVWLLVGCAFAVVYILGFYVSLIAVDDAGTVRDRRGTAGGLFLPWHATPATLRAKTGPLPVRLNNDCHLLRYLGNDGHSHVLYDNRLDKVFRIPVGDVTVSTTRSCRGRVAPILDPGMTPVVVGIDGRLALTLPAQWDDVVGAGVLSSKPRGAPLDLGRVRFTSKADQRSVLRFRVPESRDRFFASRHAVPARLDLRIVERHVSRFLYDEVVKDPRTKLLATSAASWCVWLIDDQAHAPSARPSC